MATPSTPASTASSITAGSCTPAPFSAAAVTTQSVLEQLGGYLSEDDVTRSAMDVLWADPASVQMEASGSMDASGFGPGIRGGDTFCFGEAAVDAFLHAYGFQVWSGFVVANRCDFAQPLCVCGHLQYVIRAHQATAAGVDISASAKVCTVFSTSKDHGCGPAATCGCLLIDGGVIHPITRSHCYDMSVTPSAHHCTTDSSRTHREEGLGIAARSPARVSGACGCSVAFFSSELTRRHLSWMQ